MAYTASTIVDINSIAMIGAGVITGINSITSASGNALVLATGTSGIAATFASGTNALTLSQGALNFTGAATITGGAGNMTIVSGTGNSRTMSFQTTTSGGTATTALTLGADQSAVFAGRIGFTGGSASSPAIYNTADTDTGFFFGGGGENRLGFVIDGATRAEFNTSGLGIDFTLKSNLELTWCSGSPGSQPNDLFLSRYDAAVLHMGRANAASPVAQTIGAQGSRSGTDSNVGGANLTIRSGIGTGTGTASSLIFQTPALAASGTGAQTSTTRLTLNETAATLTVGLTTPGGATFHTTSTALTDGAGAATGTLLNAPSAGNPTKWIGINDNGTTRYIPAW